ncbi:MAG TPA: CPBP family intramembrane metalloprotease [Flavobacteriales bacterium]|nr:CPBP family intramembrane metalloprotease [Flavobacteriales bacterium]
MSDSLREQPSLRVAVVGGVLLVVALYVMITSDAFGTIRYTSSEMRGWYANGACWVAALLVALYARRVEGRGVLLWAERPPKLKFTAVAVIALLVMLGVFLTILSVLWRQLASPEPSGMQGLEKFAPLMSNGVLVFSAFTAGITEEFLFRGYMLPRVVELTGRNWMAILLTSLFFGLAHYRQDDLKAMVFPMLIGVAFSLFYVQYRSILVLMICHVTIDLVLF